MTDQTVPDALPEQQQQIPSQPAPLFDRAKIGKRVSITHARGQAIGLFRGTGTRYGQDVFVVDTGDQDLTYIPSNEVEEVDAS